MAKTKAFRETKSVSFGAEDEELFKHATKRAKKAYLGDFSKYVKDLIKKDQEGGEDLFTEEQLEQLRGEIEKIIATRTGEAAPVIAATAEQAAEHQEKREEQPKKIDPKVNDALNRILKMGSK